MSKIAYSEIEKNLKSDISGKYKSELIDIFTHEVLIINHELNKGVRPDVYQSLSKTLKSLTLAIEVVNEVWFFFHPQINK